MASISKYVILCKCIKMDDSYSMCFNVLQKMCDKKMTGNIVLDTINIYYTEFIIKIDKVFFDTLVDTI